MIITKKASFLKPLAYLWVASIVVLSSCEEKVDITPGDTESVENEAAADSYFEDTDDMATLAVASDDGTFTGSRVSGGRDVSKDRLGRFACPSTTVTLVFAEDSTPEVPHGIITIDFGSDGCDDGHGNIRKGSVVVEFRNKRFLPGATIVTTLVDYEINGIALEGTRTVANASGSTQEVPKFTILLEGGKATWPDGTFATREVSRTREWYRSVNPLNDQWTISGTASGINRNGNAYEINITKPLVFRRECAVNSRIFIAVEGTKELIVDGKKITIDYGASTCDRLITITINGVSREVEVKGDM